MEIFRILKVVSWVGAHKRWGRPSSAFFGSFICILLTCWIASSRSAFAVDEPPLRVATLPGDQTLAHQLEGLGFDVIGTTEREIWLCGPDSELDRLRGFGFAPVVRFQNSNDYAKSVLGESAYRLQSNDAGAYHTYEETIAELDALAAAHPGLVQVLSIGTTHEGREIRGVKISDNVSQDEDEPEFVVTCLQHAREWITVEAGLGIAHHLADNYSTDSQVRNIVDNAVIYVFPDSNPDGHVRTVNVERLWRKNRIPNYNGTFGVDINRNFDGFWGIGSAADPTTSSDTYQGPGPFSEAESAALRDFVASRSRLVVLWNIHSYGQMILYPFAYSTTPPPNVAVYSQIANLIRDGINAVNSMGYVAGQWSVALGYQGSGATEDWFYVKTGVPAIGTELRPTGSPGFILPEDQIAPTVAEVLGGATALFQWGIGLWEDPTSPTISNVQVAGTTYNGATITFDTNRTCRAAVSYGVADSTTSATAFTTFLASQHSVTVSGLAQAGSYKFRAVARDLGLHVGRSGEGNFSTPSGPVAQTTVDSRLPASEDTDGDAQYKTLAAAIAGTANSGTCTILDDGPFYEAVAMARPMTLRGAIGTRPVIVALGAQSRTFAEDYGLFVKTDGKVVLENLVVIPNAGDRPTRGLGAQNAGIPGTDGLDLTMKNVLVTANNGSDQPATSNGLQTPSLGFTAFLDDSIDLGKINDGLAFNHFYIEDVIASATTDPTGDNLRLFDRGQTTIGPGCRFTYAARYGVQVYNARNVSFQGAEGRPVVVANNASMGIAIFLSGAPASAEHFEWTAILNNGQAGLQDDLIVGTVLLKNCTLANNSQEAFRSAATTGRAIVAQDSIIAGNGSTATTNVFRMPTGGSLLADHSAMVTQGALAFDTSADPQGVVGSHGFVNVLPDDPALVVTPLSDPNLLSVNNSAFVGAASGGTDLVGAGFLGAVTAARQGWFLYE
ncbi:MAG: M14 family metallopeptidase [bacterium]